MKQKEEREIKMESVQKNEGWRSFWEARNLVEMWKTLEGVSLVGLEAQKGPGPLSDHSEESQPPLSKGLSGASPRSMCSWVSKISSLGLVRKASVTSWACSGGRVLSARRTWAARIDCGVPLRRWARERTAASMPTEAAWSDSEEGEGGAARKEEEEMGRAAPAEAGLKDDSRSA